MRRMTDSYRSLIELVATARALLGSTHPMLFEFGVDETGTADWAFRTCVHGCFTQASKFCLLEISWTYLHDHLPMVILMLIKPIKTYLICSWFQNWETETKSKWRGKSYSLIQHSFNRLQTTTTTTIRTSGAERENRRPSRGKVGFMEEE